MNILVVMHLDSRSRRTIKDHLYSFKRYVDNCAVFYVDLGYPDGLTKKLTEVDFDAVIFHYSFLALRFTPGHFKKLYNELLPRLKKLSGVKVLLPHDEYIYTEALWQIINDLNVSRVYTCLPRDTEVIYPAEKIGPREDFFRTVYTGYVDERLKASLDKKLNKRHSSRPVDIVYRSTQSLYSFGMAGQVKVKVNDAFHEVAEEFPQLVSDVGLTNQNNFKNSLLGKKWFRFLINSRTAIGTLSGSSLLDVDGTIRAETQAYIREHDGTVTDEEIERECYRGRDGKVKSLVFGPRHFEYAMTRTCPVFVEGDYEDQLKPGEHYIEIKKDFSNMRDVLRQVMDKERCAQIADNYRLVMTDMEKYSYRFFANSVTEDIRTLLPVQSEEQIQNEEKQKANTASPPGLLHMQKVRIAAQSKQVLAVVWMRIKARTKHIFAVVQMKSKLALAKFQIKMEMLNMKRIILGQKMIMWIRGIPRLPGRLLMRLREDRPDTFHKIRNAYYKVRRREPPPLE